MSEAARQLDTEVCDPETVADLAELFGKARLIHLLGGLEDEIGRRLDAASARNPSLRGDAHALVSVSGTLGFSALSQACSALEQACIDGGDVAGALDAAKIEAARARPVIANLREDHA